MDLFKGPSVSRTDAHGWIDHLSSTHCTCLPPADTTADAWLILLQQTRLATHPHTWRPCMATGLRSRSSCVVLAGA